MTALHSKTSDDLAKAREDAALVKSGVVPLQFEVERVKKEKTVLKTHSEYLEGEVRCWTQPCLLR